MAPDIRCLNYAAYRAEVVVQDNTLAYAQNIHGMWDIDRYVNLLMGEIPRLTDDADSYGPRGKTSSPMWISQPRSAPPTPRCSLLTAPAPPTRPLPAGKHARLPFCILCCKGGFFMALFQNGVDVSRYQGSINWTQVAAAGKQFAIVRVGSSNSGGLYVDPYFLQNVTGAHSAGLRVGAYYYTYARTRAAVASELTAFLNMLEGIKLEYPVFVDVEDASLTSLGRAELTSLVQYAMDILYQRKWYAGWYSYTNYINSYLNAGALANYPLWVADYRATLGYTGAYTMWQYSGSGTVSGISGACDLNRSYKNFLPEIQAGGYNNYGAASPSVQKVDGYKLVVFNARCEYFYTSNLNDVVGYLPLGNYCVTGQTTAKYEGYDWVTFKYQGEEYWTALLGDRNRLEKCECNCN